MCRIAARSESIMTDVAEIKPKLAIEIKNLSKSFGNVLAVDNVSITIEQGQLFGFIGPNGAGKTTTIKILATLTQPDGGMVKVMGHPVGSKGDHVRRAIGYMPDILGSYPELAVWEYLDFFGATYGLSGKERKRVIDQLFDLVDLGGKRLELVGSLSRGMQQRLGLARALIHDPQVLLLDEPASGLDPRARIELRAILQELQRMGKTILLSSHILTELAEISTHVGIIEQGQMVYCGGVEDALSKARTARRFRLRVQGDHEQAIRLLEKQPDCVTATVEDGELLVELTESADGPEFIAAALVPEGIGILSLQEEQASLEEAFMELTKGIVS
jgi:ABC-2 type transport system ATP-binding protein